MFQVGDRVEVIASEGRGSVTRVIETTHHYGLFVRLDGSERDISRHYPRGRDALKYFRKLSLLELMVEAAQWTN